MKLIYTTTIICITLFGLYGIFALLTKQGNSKANKLIGLFFLLWSLDFLDGLLLLEGFYLENTSLALWNDSFVFLYGPLLYLYTIYAAEIPPKFNWRFLIHLIPFLISIVATGLFFHTLSGEEKKDILKSIVRIEQPEGIYWVIGIIYLHFFLYLFLAKKHIKKITESLNNFYSNHNLRWLKLIVNSFLIILTLSVLNEILLVRDAYLYFKIGLPLLTILMAVFVGVVFWKSLHMPIIVYAGTRSMKKTSPLDPAKTQEVLKKIIDILEKQRLFLISDFSLQDLSEAIGYNKRIVSQVINEKFEKSFFDLVNSYRIEEAKKRFKKNQDPGLTVSEVMYDVGFNSKSSFNTQFKKKGRCYSFRIYEI